MSSSIRYFLVSLENNMHIISHKKTLTIKGGKILINSPINKPSVLIVRSREFSRNMCDCHVMIFIAGKSKTFSY